MSPTRTLARASIDAHFAKTQKYAEVPARRGLEPAAFGIFVDPLHCKGCSECVSVCHELGYDALHMIEKAALEPSGERALDRVQRDFRFFRSLPPTPPEYRNERALADLMLGEHAFGYVGGAGSCSGCGEATALRMLVAATRQVHGPESMGMVAATGCNTVYGSTYPFNPYQIPWTNSLFENAPAMALGIRARWDADGQPDRRLWVVGGDGAMYDIGFQALSRMVASGADIKVLVLDTQVYSNTGGQASTATFGGQVTKLSAFGKAQHGRPERRKELGRILMAHGEVYVAQTTPAHINHFYRAVMEANAYPGPAVVVAYTPCQPEHGIADDASTRQAKLAVDSRAFPLFTYDPRRGADDARATLAPGQPGAPRGLDDTARRDAGRLPLLRPDRGPLRPALRRGRDADARDRSRPRTTACGTGGCSRNWPARRRAAPPDPRPDRSRPGSGPSRQPRSRRARSRSPPSDPSSRYDQPPSAAHATDSTDGPRLRRERVLQPGDARDRSRRVDVARGDDGLLEPVGVDRVVRVVQRIELLRANGERVAEGVAGGSPRDTRARPNVAAGASKISSKTGGMRVGAPRASSRTQSMWIQARGRPSASTKSVRRRDQTRRKPTTRVVAVSEAPTAIGAVTASSAARTSQVSRCSAYHARSKPSVGGVHPGEVLGVAQDRRRAQETVRPGLVEADPIRGAEPVRPGPRAGHRRASASRSSDSRLTRSIPAVGAV